MEKETIVLLSEKVFLFVHNLGIDWTDFMKTERLGEYRHPIYFHCTLVCVLYTCILVVILRIILAITFEQEKYHAWKTLSNLLCSNSK
jgi:hypothetical protein